nr:iron ABC transporter permease [Ureaplasma parvum]
MIGVHIEKHLLTKNNKKKRESMKINQKTNLKQKHFYLIKNLNYKQSVIIKMAGLILIAICFVFLTLAIYFDTTNGFEASINQFNFNIRGPKTLMAFFSGGAIAVAGLLLQKVTRNHLADTSVLGIGSLNIILMTVYLILIKDKTSSYLNPEMRILPLVMFLSSIFGTSIVYTLSKLGRANNEKFIIIGIALNFLFEAISVVLINPANNSLFSNQDKNLMIAFENIKNYTLGIIPNSQYIDLSLVISCSVLIALTLIPIWFLRKKIDLYETSAALASTTGINIERLKISIYLLVALLAGLEIVLVGYIALLGVIGASVARQLFGNRTGITMFAAFLIGATLVCFALLISVNFNTQVPVGFLSTTIITPYFMYLIVRGK